ncbi:MAG: dual specificity protein phosphatase family protein [Planctomycetes bacterium]|nr:dual specificity protein phosphatase family protein [Planctomycetota bacterium]
MMDNPSRILAVAIAVMLFAVCQLWPDKSNLHVRESRGEGSVTVSVDKEQAALDMQKSKWARRVELPDMNNFYKVSDALYRSYQPTPEGFRAIEKMGIKSVVNLRHLHSDDDELEGTTLRSFRIKCDAWEGGIALSDVVKFLKIVNDPDNQPVLVHCQHGSDRTGTMCAIYRIVIEGWDKEDAIREMTEGPYGYHSIWKSLPGFIRSLDVEKLRSEIKLASE